MGHQKGKLKGQTRSIALGKWLADAILGWFTPWTLGCGSGGFGVLDTPLGLHVFYGAELLQNCF